MRSSAVSRRRETSLKQANGTFAPSPRHPLYQLLVSLVHVSLCSYLRQFSHIGMSLRTRSPASDDGRPPPTSLRWPSELIAQTTTQNTATVPPATPIQGLSNAGNDRLSSSAQLPWPSQLVAAKSHHGHSLGTSATPSAVSTQTDPTFFGSTDGLTAVHPTQLLSPAPAGQHAFDHFWTQPVRDTSELYWPSLDQAAYVPGFEMMPDRPVDAFAGWDGLSAPYRPHLLLYSHASSYPAIYPRGYDEAVPGSPCTVLECSLQDHHPLCPLLYDQQTSAGTMSGPSTPQTRTYRRIAPKPSEAVTATSCAPTEHPEAVDDGSVPALGDDGV